MKRGSYHNSRAPEICAALDRGERRRNRGRKVNGVESAEPVDDLGPTRERVSQFGSSPSRFKTDTNRIISRLSIVDGLYEADEISPEGFLAATIFTSDYFIGIHVQSTSSFADKVDGSGNGDHYNAKRMDAAKRFTAARTAIGQAYSAVLMAVVVDGEMSLRQFGIERMGTTARTNATAKAKSLLVKAINSLAKFYAPVAKPPRPRTRAHAMAGSRPAIHR